LYYFLPLIPKTNLRSDVTKAVAFDVFTIKVLEEDYEKAFLDTRTFNEVAVVVGNATREVMNAKKALKRECEPIEITTDSRNCHGQKWEDHTPVGLENNTDYYTQMEAMSIKKVEVRRRYGDPEAVLQKLTK
jgi:isoquinoline 1-oxidoreductase beta subunit